MKKVQFSLLILVLLVACGEEVKVPPAAHRTHSDAQTVIAYSKKQMQELRAASKLVYNLPSPAEMARLLHQTNAIYDVEILSNPKAEGIYNTDLAKAFNLGVYFADLSFTSMFDYPQQAMLFMSAAQGISEELDIVGVFNEELMQRIESNISNKDSIMDIVASAYIETDFYLQENDRSIIAKAILAGGWIEGLYIATHLKTDNVDDGVIWERIGEQKSAVSNLIKMMEGCNEPQLDELISKLKKLEIAYEGVEVIQRGEGFDTLEIGMSNKKNVIVSNMTAANIDLEASACREYLVIGK